jgi:hypothetical protein
VTPLALEQTHTLWQIALGLGLVVALVVVVLMAMLLSFLKDIEASAATLLEVGGQVAGNTAAIPDLAATGPVLEQIKEEALIHDAYLAEQTG